MSGQWHDLIIGGKLPKEGIENIVELTIEDWSDEDPIRYTCFGYYSEGDWYEYARYSGEEFEIIDDIVAWREVDLRPYTDDWRKEHGR